MSVDAHRRAALTRPVSAHLERYLHVYAIVGIALSFIALYARALAQGGRWDLYEPVAMADRIGSYFAYTTGSADALAPSTPYFLGVAVISFIAKHISADFQIEILLFTATLSVFLLQICLFTVYRRIGGKEDVLVFFGLSLAVTLFCLNRYLDYALEFKPDTAALIFFSLLTAVVLSEMALWPRLLFLIVLAAGASLFKQQVLVAIAALGMARLAWGGPFARRFIDTTTIAIGASIGLAISLSVENAIFFTVLSHMGRPTVKLLDMEHADLLIRAALLGALALALHKFRGLLREITRTALILPYSVPTVVWFLVCIAGARNLGGNSGNTAVGLILLVPFAVVLLDRLDVRAKTLIFIAISLYSLAYLGGSGWLARYQDRVASEVQIAEELGRAKVQTALISGDSYIAARRAGVDRVSEIDSWAHIHNGISSDRVAPDGPALIAEINPDAIVCMQSCSVFKPYGFDPAGAGYREVKVPASTLGGVLFLRQ